MPVYKFTPRLPEPAKSDNTRVQMPKFEVDKQISAAIKLREKERAMTREKIKKAPLITPEEKVSILMSTKKLDKHAYLNYPEKPHAMKAVKKESTGDKVIDVLENPLDAFQYAVSGGGIKNMPRNYSDMKHAGVVDPFTKNNLVSKALEVASYLHPVTGVIHGVNAMRYTSDDIAKAAKTGDWKDIKNAGISVGSNLLDFTPAALVGRSGRLLNGATGAGLRTMQVASKLPGGNAVNSFIGNKLIPRLNQLDGGVVRSFEDTKISQFFPTVNPLSNTYNPIHRKTWNAASSAGRALDRRQAFKVISPSEKFKSEIDWGKWNKEILENKALMQEYNAIEYIAKQDGSWMKNPDGSKFDGTAEQFVQQQSVNFKKAFPNPILDGQDNIQINYHGSPNKLENDFFDGRRSKGGLHGSGIYTSYGKKTADNYLSNNPNGNLYELYINSNKPQNIVTNRDFVKYKKESNLLKDKYKNAIHEQGKDVVLKQLNDLDTEWGIKYRQQLKMQYLKEGFDFFQNDVNQIVPYSNYPKSAIGNNGMFDMKNPNIYKAFTGVLGGSLLYNKKD